MNRPVLLVIALLSAFAHASEAPAPIPVPNGRILTLGPLEAEFAAIEKEVPGFAGWHFDRDGKAVVSLKDLGRSEEALARIAPHAKERLERGARGRAPASLELRAQQARYSFLQLAAFRDAVYAGFPGGIGRLDVDEVKNVLALGVDEPSDVGRIRSFVAKLGIPADAVTVEVVPAVSNRVYLWERHRPLRGGSRIAFLTRDGYRGECTLGVNGVYDNNSNNAGFITASHCTQYPWYVTGNSVGQPSWRASDEVAREYADPQVFTQADNYSCPIDTPLSGGWAAFQGCRWSDAAFYRYTSSQRATAWGGPTIHTTTYRDGGMPGSTIINGYLPVTSDAPPAVFGTYVDKMGATSGWTDGSVYATCVNQQNGGNHPDDDRVLLLCQDITDLYIDAGDSGAPVYARYATYTQWMGIVWGEIDHWRETYHSPAWNVRQDLTGFSY